MRRVYREPGGGVKRAALLALCTLFLGAGDLEEQLARSRYLEQQLDRLTRLFQEGASDEVLRIFDSELELADLSPRLWNLRGLALESTGQVDAAIAAYEAGLRLDPSRPELHQNLAIALVARGATGRALSEFEQALQLDPTALEARLGLGNELLRLGRGAAARPHLERALERAPGDPRVHSAMALLADSVGDREASQRWWSALERSRPTADSARRLAELEIESEPDSALAHFDRCAVRDTVSQDCLLAAGTLLLNTGDPEAARLRFEAAEARAPLDATAEMNLLLALHQMAAVDEMERRVAARPPLSGSAWGVVALTRREQGDRASATIAARRAVELAPGDPALRNLLAVLLAENGDVREARAIWREILSAHPDHPEAKANLAAYGPD